MSVLTDLIYGGSHAVAGLTEGAVNDAIAKYGADQEIAFPDTAYFFPTIYAATGVKVKTLGDLTACVGVLKSLITDQEDLGQALNAGLATAVGAEILEGLKYVNGAEPYANDSGIGFVPDPIIRSLGVPLVTGDIPGVAVVLGKAAAAEDVAKVVKDYQSKGIMTFLVGDVIEQCAEGGVKMGLEMRVVPLGHDVTSVIHVVTVAIRAALIFGNVQPGDLAGLLDYTKNRVPAFVNTFGEIDAVVVSAGAGAIALGFPVVVDIDLGENQVPGALESVCDHAETVKKSLELRGIKIKSKELPIPVAFAAAFEGEIIRKADMKVEFWSGKNPTAELVLMKDLSEVEDHKITIEGSDIDCGEKDFALATYVKVAGKKMQADFESVIERKIHAWFNYMEGVMHTGQRNQIRIRVSNAAYDAGLRLKHFGEVLYHMIMDEFDAVVDKCEVTLITDKAATQKFLDEVAMPRYNARDDRLASMTDEAVDQFYTCILCQSFAPAHCCVVTPERLGLCGAVSWLDAKATNELNPNGPCQPIPKDGLIDERTGRYEAVNRIVEEATHGAVSSVTLYSILEDPMTSCGCFECICGIEPASNGFIVVNREYKGMTPAGMTFGELASCTGGGVQTPGYMGHGRHFISSKKFIYAEGGIERIVWMPKELKDDVADKLNATAKELYGIDNFTDFVADETICTEVDDLMNFLTEKNHPVLAMEPLM
ncbi:MAG TPA: CO dehydrogenase/CO-methylating acetyl-CoA synthase complex subunit beta [Candidatus Avoscillospira stercorigallinarum]|uniref:CO-methylating acetyl-CoA synthase n=1 Tax=Candidatus Avoscillospira stercorigallinarum TaxID=2840708 RepID=A0A9D0Z4A6_9FIRM|nr:CO dehydrogenase/CO-methylating acetyl-CoA synthase complex subunit beta [Candidatus Avoscillospira stercorigallinarum]